MSNPSFLSPDDVAARLGLHVDSVRRLCRKGEIPHRKIGGRIYIAPDAITPPADAPVDSSTPAPADSTEEVTA